MQGFGQGRSNQADERGCGAIVNIVCWKWKQPGDALHPRKAIKFGPDHVNHLHTMIAANLKEPFQLHCITDDGAGLKPEINIIPLWDDFRAMGGCYTRLKVFHEDMADLIGQDFFSIDLDVLITGDITDLINHTRSNYDFKIWGDTNPTTPYNGSFFYMKAGARRQVYHDFHPVTSPAEGIKRKYVGTDQAWIGACLGPHESKWTTADGVFSFRVHFGPRMTRTPNKRDRLLGDERIIFFHGSNDPSKPKTWAQAPWVRQFWK